MTMPLCILIASKIAGGIVSNHCSYVDVLILLSRYFPSFVARSNTKNMPFIGLCRYAPVSLLSIILLPSIYMFAAPCAATTHSWASLAVLS